MCGVIIKKDKSASQYRQLYEQLRDRIIRGEIPASARLASTRVLARELRLSRAIMLEVIEQLKVEGYAHTRHSSGTYIAEGLDYSAGGWTGPRTHAPVAVEISGQTTGLHLVLGYGQVREQDIAGGIALLKQYLVV
ncbi:MAG: winged helix-turn-helix transcriptional regulator [Spirochaetales bacterium]|nr:winged helix-turn-helix transcriptional regulator [Spirochaetales bacterium]